MAVDATQLINERSWSLFYEHLQLPSRDLNTVALFRESPLCSKQRMISRTFFLTALLFNGTNSLTVKYFHLLNYIIMDFHENLKREPKILSKFVFFSYTPWAKVKNFELLIESC